MAFPAWLFGMICVGWGCSGEDEVWYKNDLEPVPSFTEGHTAYEHVKTSLYAHIINECDKQNIWNLEGIVSSET
jgi:hypothetical protein